MTISGPADGDAILCEALTNTQGQLQRLEAGIYVAREVVRELYVRDGS